MPMEIGVDCRRPEITISQTVHFPRVFVSYSGTDCFELSLKEYLLNIVT